MKTRRSTLLPVAAAAAMALTAGAASALEFHGYLRSGAGSNSKDGGQTCFTLPGTPGASGTKYRLGNECETYAELGFDQELFESKTGNVKFVYHGMLSYSTGQNAGTDTYQSIKEDGRDLAVRQNWVEAKNIPMFQGGSVWVGNRYYQRNDIHINDFFYWDASGTGVGVEGMKLGGFNVSYGLFRSTYGQDTAVTRHDARVGGINLGGFGELTVGAQYNTADTSVPEDNHKGGGFTLQHHMSGVLGGYNKMAFQYSKGTVAQYDYGAPAIGAGDNANSTGAKKWRFVEILQWQMTPEFSGMASFVYQDSKSPNSNWIGFNSKWTSIGVRPVYAVNDYFRLVAELGYDRIKPNSTAAYQRTMNLTKFTIAPTIAPGKGFWDRPELRVFYTYAKWNDAARDIYGGAIANGKFGTATSGSTIGFQVEAWW